MKQPAKKLSRAEAARANGAKSRRPKTPEGQAKCARAVALTHEFTLLPNESRELFEHIAAPRVRLLAACPTSIQLLHELIDINWRIKRARFLKPTSSTAPQVSSLPLQPPGWYRQLDCSSPGASFDASRSKHLALGNRRKAESR